MARVKVEFKVVAKNADKLYLVGSSDNLGNWNVSKAVKFDYCDKCQKFSASKLFEEGELVEFKVLKDKTFDAVEKGFNGEEVQNHSFVASKGLVIEFEVTNFAN